MRKLFENSPEVSLPEYSSEAALGLALTDCAPQGRGAQASREGFTACPARPSRGGLQHTHVFLHSGQFYR